MNLDVLLGHLFVKKLVALHLFYLQVIFIVSTVIFLICFHVFFDIFIFFDVINRCLITSFKR